MYKIFLMVMLAILILVACNKPETRASSTTTPTPQPDIPRYTSAEVIDLVKTKLTEGACQPVGITRVQAASGTSIYTGNGVWSVMLRINLVTNGDNIFTFREATQTVVAANEIAAQNMGILKNCPQNRNLPRGGTGPFESLELDPKKIADEQWKASQY